MTAPDTPVSSLQGGPAGYFDSQLIAPHYRPPSNGCTSCGRADTATLTLREGRRCADCAPQFDPDHAVDLWMRGFRGLALAYARWAGEVA